VGLAGQATLQLGVADERDVIAFLSGQPSANVYLLWRIAQGVLRQPRGHERFYGMRDPDSRRLRAVIGAGANLVPAGSDRDALYELGQLAALCGERPRMLIGPRAGVDALWRGFQQALDPNVQLDTVHIGYELLPDDLAPELGLQRLHVAAMSDLIEVEEASAQMLIDDLDRRDRDEDPGLFRRRMRHAISQGEVFIYRDRGELVFKLNLGARTGEATQLQGIFTARSRRGEGLCRRGTAEVCRRLFSEGVPMVNLFVREDNLAARRSYEAVGFVPAGQLRMIILKDCGRLLDSVQSVG